MWPVKCWIKKKKTNNQTEAPGCLQHCRLPVLMQVSKIFWKTQEENAVVKECKLVSGANHLSLLNHRTQETVPPPILSSNKYTED